MQERSSLGCCLESVVQSRKEALALEKKIKKRGAKRFLEDLEGEPPVSVTPQA